MLMVAESDEAANEPGSITHQIPIPVLNSAISAVTVVVYRRAAVGVGVVMAVDGNGRRPRRN
ncbi:hypothetical protein AWC15_05110 [Mycobacterium lacus]|nr:hypothetical protein AWC15_05110 [Mycobacterium lacus]